MKAMRSPLFVVRVVEMGASSDRAPVNTQSLVDLAAVPTGKVSLFDLDLDLIEERLLTEPWVRSVHLQKRFPQTLSIQVTFRQPKALLQEEGGQLAYVDGNGTVFGTLDLQASSDLPVISGILRENTQEISDALSLLEAWEQNEGVKTAQIAALDYTVEDGYQIWVTYEISKQKDNMSRSRVRFGQKVDGEFEVQVNRVAQVFQYLSTRGLSAHQIRADVGKKIVVKIAHGS